MNRKRMILAGLLVVLAICLVYAYLATPRLEKASFGSEVGLVSAVPEKTLSQGSKKDSARIDFSFLNSPPEETPRAQRDIFSFVQRPVVQRKPAPVVIVPTEPVVNVAVVPEPVDFEAIQKSLSRFTFLGFLDKAGEKTVFLSSAGKLFLVKSGESFGQHSEFTVTDITDKTLKVKQPNTENLIEIPLIEKQKLAAAVSSPVNVPREEVIIPQADNSRALRPQRRILRPTAPQGAEGSLEIPETQESSEEFNPDDTQTPQEAGTGNVLEGEVNGTNQ